jgi:hypothetical protein
LALARTQLEGGLADVARERAKGLAEDNEERAKGLAEVSEERTKGLAEVAKEKSDLHREIAAMQKQQEAQQGRVVLNIGGYRYTKSVQTLRRLPGNFFDAYFSGRYTMDRSEDGSIFIDRDGKHFGQVLQYLRDGVVSVAEKDAAELDVGELRWLKREFGFYCIELCAEPREVAFLVGGSVDDVYLASVERCDIASGAWREVAPMATARAGFGLCKVSNGEIYAIGGVESDSVALASVECYDPCLDIWSVAPSLPRPRYGHCACAVGDTIYVLGGIEIDEEGREETPDSALKFDCRIQIWSEIESMPVANVNAWACVLCSDIYIFGGKTENGMTTSTTYRFSTETNEWAALAPMPDAKSEYSVCVLDGLIYTMGGCNVDADADPIPLSSVHRFDPATNLWSAVASMSVGRVEHGAFVLDGSIYAVGGWDGEQCLTSMERYCVAEDSWLETLRGELSTVRNDFGALVVRSEMNFFDDLIARAKSERL